MPFHELQSATEPDWSRETPREWWDPSRKLLRSIRRYQAAKGPFRAISRAYWRWMHRFWSVVTGADIPLSCQIGGGLLLPHPNGVVIHPKSPIGVNCLLLQQVTIVKGARLGGHVDVGAGAKVLKDVTVGDHVQIGANAVVTGDVPSNSTAVGIPARIIRKDAPEERRAAGPAAVSIKEHVITAVAG